MSVPGTGKVATVLPPVIPRRTTIHFSDAALPVSITLWAIGVSRTNATTLGPFGLVTQLPVIFYAGVALLVLSAVVELTIEHASRWRMALHAIGLVVMLYGTPALVYPEGRYSWLYKTVGVVQYINAHGQLNSAIDIYQNWPGFFALAAWFGKVAGVGSPLAYAKWAQLVFELAALPLLYLIYDALSLTFRQRWMALMLYPAANWIGQDYLSPQGLGTVLSLGIMAITMHWLYTGNRVQSAPRRRLLGRRAAGPQQAGKQAAVSMQEVRQAYQTVRSYQGPPGIDGVTITDFEQRLAHNLQQICEQLRSGEYRPAPVRVTPIPEGGPGRICAIPTVRDRIAREVVARRLRTRLLQMRRAQADGNAHLPAGQEPGSWIIMLDAQAVSAHLPRDLMLKAVAATTEQRWVVDYVSQSFSTPVQRPDGSLGAGDISMLAGAPLAPVLTDLVLYYALDTWMGRDFPDVRFEHRPDSVAVHCTSERQARSVQEAITRRLDDVGLALSPYMIRIVPGQDGGSTVQYGNARSDLTSPAASGYRSPAAGPRRPRATPSADLLVPPGRRTAFVVTILLLFFVLTFTHELSPYIVAVQLLVLAAARPLRPRWLPLAMLAIAVAYLLPRLSFVNSHYGLLSSVGSFFGNAAPPAASSYSGLSIPASEAQIQHCDVALSVTMWLLALVGAWRLRHSGRIVLALVVLAYSPVLVLFGQAYGNEGILRVYLFSLPWAAALAAAAVEPGTLSRKMMPRLRTPTGGLALSWVKPALRWLRAPVALWFVLALFFVAFYGNDAVNTVPQTEVNALLAFQQHARLGPVYLAEDNAPAEDTDRYYLFPWINIFGSRDGTPLVNQATPDIAELIAENSITYTQGQQPAYVVIAPSMVPYNAAYAQAPPDSFQILQESLARSPEWKLIVNQDGTMIYELPPGAGSSSAERAGGRSRPATP